MLSRLPMLATVILLAGVVTGGCTVPDTQEEGGASDTASRSLGGNEGAPEIQATNVFYYYENLDRAWRFYTEVMGFETVADYGFAKILRVAPASYLTLVDETEGMHGPDEPKSVTLALVTQQVRAWYEYLVSQNVSTLSPYERTAGRPHDGFVAVDPEGYYLEIERFNPHPENRDLIPLLDAVKPLGPAQGQRPEELTVQATVLWLYYDELPPLERFWEELLGVDLLVDQGWAKIYPVSETGFIGLVDGARGLHEATEEKAVTVSFLTRDLSPWLGRAMAQELEVRREGAGAEGDRVRTFVAVDPGGYTLEWDAFLDHPQNERLLEALNR